MTTHSRIAAFLSTSALCLGLAAAPSAFAETVSSTAAPAKSQMHKSHHKAAAKTAKPAAHAKHMSSSKSGAMSTMDKK